MKLGDMPVEMASMQKHVIVLGDGSGSWCMGAVHACTSSASKRHACTYPHVDLWPASCLLLQVVLYVIHLVLLLSATSSCQIRMFRSYAHGKYQL